ncbi:MAG: nucleotidyl transferase AbiEii/AbiGii toxin family protein [Sterolibacterium sp.]|nr:nucleotidyl transferase AbiEii/AbiGii toxin family protein [Sterolibacterium sp.]
MNQTWLDTARLLTQVAPLVFVDDTFALKGGTAINLFVRDMPRLSVDLDLIFPDHTLPRDEALASHQRGRPASCRATEEARIPDAHTSGSSRGDQAAGASWLDSGQGRSQLRHARHGAAGAPRFADADGSRPADG